MPGPGAPNRASRLRIISLLAGVAVNGLTMMTWTGQWFMLRLVGGQTGHPDLPVAGSVAAPALVALSLAGLALMAALALAGPVFRVVLGVLQSLIGVCVVLSTVLAIIDPVKVSMPVITKATGVTGSASTAQLVQSVGQSGWPWFALALGVGSIGLGVLVVLHARHWPQSSRRYQAVRFAGDRSSGGDAVEDWDDLSHGKDPTVDPAVGPAD